MEKQAIEFCLLGVSGWLTCLTKSEWAAWVQAIGSIAAIWWAVWTVWRQAAEKAAESARAASVAIASLDGRVQVTLVSVRHLHRIVKQVVEFDGAPETFTAVLSGLENLMPLDPLAIAALTHDKPRTAENLAGAVGTLASAQQMLRSTRGNTTTREGRRDVASALEAMLAYAVEQLERSHVVLSPNSSNAPEHQ